MQIKYISMLKFSRSLRVLAGGIVIGCQLIACSNQTKVDSYETLQHPPELHITSSIKPQPSKNNALLKKGLGEQIKLIENARESVLKMNLDKDFALEALGSALEYNHIEIIDQDQQLGYVLIQVKNEKPALTETSSTNEHVSSDGVYSSGEGFLDNVSNLWSSKTATVSEEISRYKLSAKQKENTTLISAHQLATGASFTKPNAEYQKQLFSTLYKSLRDGFTSQ